jgi:FAD-dependent oxidoreductase family protein
MIEARRTVDRGDPAGTSRVVPPGPGMLGLPTTGADGSPLHPARGPSLGQQVDVVVVGGRPAGLAAAIAARQRELRVLVVEAATPPIDKACGEGVMPNGVAALRRLGVTIPFGASMPFRGIRFVGPGDASTLAFKTAPGSGYVGRRSTVCWSSVPEDSAYGSRGARPSGA